MPDKPFFRLVSFKKAAAALVLQSLVFAALPSGLLAQRPFFANDPLYRDESARRTPDDETARSVARLQGEDRRLIRRRVWLRRSEDEAQYDLVDIAEAAQLLATNSDEIEKWVRTADLPFYMVTRGANREVRFDRHELLGWLGVEDVVEARTREDEGT